MKCPQCQTPNPDSRKSCMSCGAPLHQEVDSGKIKAVYQLHKRYELQTIIQRGPRWTVYQAQDRKSGAMVAIKRPTDGYSQSAVIDAFFKDASQLAGNPHPHIVAIHEIFNSPPAVIMEFLTGPTLRDYLQAQGSLELGVALELVQTIGQALAWAHKNYIIHKALHPGNLMFAAGQSLKILDFGAVYLAEELTPDISRYLAPEQQQSPTKVTYRSNIYSLGRLFYEMLTNDSGPVDVKRLPEVVQLVITCCLETDPGERYFSMDEMLEMCTVCANALSQQASPSEQGAASSVVEPSGAESEASVVEPDVLADEPITLLDMDDQTMAVLDMYDQTMAVSSTDQGASAAATPTFQQAPEAIMAAPATPPAGADEPPQSQEALAEATQEHTEQTPALDATGAVASTSSAEPDVEPLVSAQSSTSDVRDEALAAVAPPEPALVAAEDATASAPAPPQQEEICESAGLIVPEPAASPAPGLDMSITPATTAAQLPALIIQAPKFLDKSNIRQFEQALLELGSQEAKLFVISFAQCQHMDFTGMGGLAKIKEKLAANDIVVKLAAVPDKIITLFGMLNMTAIYQVYASEEEALNS